MPENLRHKNLYVGLTFFLIIFIYTTTLSAGSVTFSWYPPTTNNDGTPLNDLAGYKLYYGTSSGSYDYNINVGNVATYQITNLTGGLTYYFAITAYDISGNESDYSAEVSATIDPSPPPAPEITATDSIAPVNDLQIPFGDITDGSSSNQTVTIINNGNADLEIYNIAQANQLMSPFSILNDYCSGQIITPSLHCTFIVRFSPTSTGLFNDTFDIPSDDPDENSVTITVSGTGIAITVPDITVTDSIGSANDLQMPFGDLTEGLSLDQTVTITNNGSTSLDIDNIAQNNQIELPFSILNDNCSGQTITPSSNCTFTVRFSPTTTGSFNDTFDISSNDPDENPVILTISGTGLSSISNNPPSTPDLIYPANGQKGLGTTVQFTWEESTDPDGDPVIYNFHVCEDANLTIGCITGADIASLRNNGIYYAGIVGYGTGLLLIGVVTALIGTTGRRKKVLLLIVMIFIAGMLLVSCASRITQLNGVSHTVSGLNSDTTYYWKVVAKDGFGGEKDSSVWSFDTL